MNESRSFQRGGSLASTPAFTKATAVVLGINCLAHLFERQWLWAALNLVFAAWGWSELRWLQRTPLVTVMDGELILYRHSWARSRRIHIDSITGVDASHPGRARIILQGGQDLTIPLHWLEWADREPFVTYLKTLVPGATR